MQDIFFVDDMPAIQISVAAPDRFNYGDNIFYTSQVVTAPGQFGLGMQKKKNTPKNERRTRFYRIKTPEGEICNMGMNNAAKLKYPGKLYYN